MTTNDQDQTRSGSGLWGMEKGAAVEVFIFSDRLTTNISLLLLPWPSWRFIIYFFFKFTTCDSFQSGPLTSVTSQHLLRYRYRFLHTKDVATLDFTYNVVPKSWRRCQLLMQGRPRKSLDIFNFRILKRELRLMASWLWTDGLIIWQKVCFFGTPVIGDKRIDSDLCNRSWLSGSTSNAVRGRCAQSRYDEARSTGWVR